MIYIDSFQFPGVENEEKFVNYIQRTCYTSFYPFGVFAENQLRECGHILSFLKSIEKSSEQSAIYGDRFDGLMDRHLFLCDSYSQVSFRRVSNEVYPDQRYN